MTSVTMPLSKSPPGNVRKNNVPSPILKSSGKFQGDSVHFGMQRYSVADPTLARRQALNAIRELLENGTPLSHDNISLLKKEMNGQSPELRTKAIKLLGETFEKGYDTSLSIVDLKVIGGDIRGQNVNQDLDSRKLAQNVAIKTLGQAIDKGKVASVPTDVQEIIFKKSVSLDEIERSTALDTIGHAVNARLIQELPNIVKNAITSGIASNDEITRHVAIKTFSHALYKNTIAGKLPEVVQTNVLPVLFKTINEEPKESSTSVDAYQSLRKMNDDGMLTLEGVKQAYQGLIHTQASAKSQSAALDILTGAIYQHQTLSSSTPLPETAQQKIIPALFKILESPKSNDESAKDSYSRAVKFLVKATDEKVITQHGFGPVLDALRKKNVHPQVKNTGINMIGNMYRAKTANEVLPSDIRQMMTEVLNQPDLSLPRDERGRMQGTVKGALSAIRNRSRDFLRRGR